MIKLNEEQIKELKSIEIDMFKEFVSVCEKLGLKYYVVGGTLLGAVRHKGFIPWDDDIDVAMPREDYEVFVAEAQQYLPQHLFVQTHKTDKKYFNNFAKIRNSNTAFIESSISHWDVNHGIYIDVFPLDYYPENSKLFGFILWLIVFRMADSYKLTKVKLKTKIVRFILRIIWPSLQKTVELREKLFKSVKDSSILANHCGAWGKKEIMPAEWFGDGTTLEFEGLMINAPAEYDKYLTQMYGDYMQLPPEEQRVGHHYVDAYDGNKSYKEYVSFK